jgi:molybdopterin converting factor subunit 1
MNILYFASLKESIQKSNEVINIDKDISVSELKLLLIKKYGDNQFKKDTICAVNQEVANDSKLLNNDDEVAFYPPVTGG